MPRRDKKIIPWNNINSEDNSHKDARENNRGSFKKRKQRKHNRKEWIHTIRQHLEDADFNMAENPSSNRSRSKHQKSPTQVSGRKKLMPLISWFCVHLPHGDTYNKDYLLATLGDRVSPLILKPYLWTVRGKAITFYVEGFPLAEKLQEINRKIECPDGRTLAIFVDGGSPDVIVNATLKSKIKAALEGRYNNEGKALDLSAFHADPLLADEFCGLFKRNILATVINLISDYVPDLQALKLDNNYIQTFRGMMINQKLPHLKILHLANNKIMNLASLEALRNLPIVELILNGNPLCIKYNDRIRYISDVRKLFPKVMRLDEEILDAPIVFDIQEEISLPASHQTFLCDVAGQEIVKKFLTEYFIAFDSNARQSLRQAYHENAMFSMTMCYPYGQKDKNTSWLNSYKKDNRNLLSTHDVNSRTKLLKQGQAAIASFLSEIPSTEHDMNSFTVDLLCCMPTMLLLTVTGIFKEINTALQESPVRYFCRTLVIVPIGSGFCITNEELHISNATKKQRENSFKLPPIVVNTPVVTIPTPSLNNENMKQQMVQVMAQQSGMNGLWSQKCLEEVDWNFERAALVFSELNKLNKIPPEAFIH